MTPKILTKEQTLNLLADITELIKADDSYGGFFQYVAIENGQYEVQASCACGNADGSQGGYLIVGDF